VGSSVQKQYIFDNVDYDAPGFTTWFSTSFFSVYLLLYIPYMIHQCRKPSIRGFDEEFVDEGKPERCFWIFIQEYPEDKIPFDETCKLGIVFCLVWLTMVGTFNFSLDRTSVASNTIISTLSGSFCMIMSCIFLKEQISPLTVIGVLTALMGAVCVGILDEEDDDGTEKNTAFGDVLALISAMVYACYSTMMKKLVQDDSRLLADLFFGVVGTFCFFVCWPLLGVLHYLEIETLQVPSLKVLAMLSVNAIVNVISDYTWVRSILLTSPLVATIGLGLTIPVAMIADVIFHDADYSVKYYGACFLVVIGFLFVNYQTLLGLEEQQRQQRKKTYAPGGGGVNEIDYNIPSSMWRSAGGSNADYREHTNADGMLSDERGRKVSSFPHLRDETIDG